MKNDVFNTTDAGLQSPKKSTQTVNFPATDTVHDQSQKTSHPTCCARDDKIELGRELMLARPAQRRLPRRVGGRQHQRTRDLGVRHRPEQIPTRAQQFSVSNRASKLDATLESDSLHKGSIFVRDRNNTPLFENGVAPASVAAVKQVQEANTAPQFTRHQFLRSHTSNESLSRHTSPSSNLRPIFRCFTRFTTAREGAVRVAGKPPSQRCAIPREAMVSPFRLTDPTGGVPEVARFPMCFFFPIRWHFTRT